MTTPYADVRETHTGLVILAADTAYKFKKPVDFGFCDFTTLAARAEACRREVELNARLAPDVYVGVGELAVPGRPAEPFVTMRRMPDEARLSTRIAAGTAADDDVRAIARLLATFHERCHHGPRVTADATREALWTRWDTNLSELETCSGSLLDPADLAVVAHEMAEFIAGRERLFEVRIDEDRIVDGHGDLLADDIFCLPDGPRILDCLEFDDRLRHVDRIDDVAFLAMDLEHLGSLTMATRLLDWYREFSDDHAPPSLVHHYVAYRALVRAKVACIRDGQGDPDARLRARSLVDTARRHLEAGAVRLVLVGGLPGTGKSSLAGQIADELGYVLLSSDRIRKELAGLVPAQSAAASYRDGIYDAQHTARLYAELCARAELLLRQGESVVLDASWSDGAARHAARDVAQRTSSRFVQLRCEAPAPIAEARMAGRRGPSDANPIIAAAMRADAEPWPDAFTVTTVDTISPPRRAVDLALAHLHPRPGGRPWPSRHDAFQKV